MSVSIKWLDIGLRKAAFWKGAFRSAWDCAKRQREATKAASQFRTDLATELARTRRRLKQVEASYCDAGLQLLDLDREHQLLKLRTPTQLNAEYERAVLAVSLGRPDASPTALAEQKRGKEMIQVVEVLATALARSFERAGLITAPKGTPQAQLLEEIRNIFDANACYNWPNHDGRKLAQKNAVAQIEQFSGQQKAIDI
jgi:hypothetical protein